MPKIDGFAVHYGTAAHDTLNAAHFAFTDRLIGDAALPKGSVKPHVMHIALAALAHDFASLTRMSCDHNAVERA
jgi:carbamate kinase